MAKYWVVGGEYTDTRFDEIVRGGEEERHGPYGSYAEARRKWAKLSMAAEENALVRYRIEHQGQTQYWVVGGTYTDTSFTETAHGEPEERIGPFDGYEAALKAWRAKAWATVDDGYVRYRIGQT